MAKSCVYYVQIGELMKVGHTTNIKSRLQSYPPNAKLIGTFPGGRLEESEEIAHLSQFIKYGLEWFDNTPETQAYVLERLKERADNKTVTFKFSIFDMCKMPLEKLLKIGRNRAGLTQVELSKKTSLARSLIAKMEAGQPVMFDSVERYTDGIGYKIIFVPKETEIIEILPDDVI